MNIGNWHVGKIAVVWVIALASYFFFDDVLGLRAYEARSGWFFAMVIAGAITWAWLSKRERRQD
jgi:uncharacterized membrane protein